MSVSRLNACHSVTVFGAASAGVPAIARTAVRAMVDLRMFIQPLLLVWLVGRAPGLAARGRPWPEVTTEPVRRRGLSACARRGSARRRATKPRLPHPGPDEPVARPPAPLPPVAAAHGSGRCRTFRAEAGSSRLATG